MSKLLDSEPNAISEFLKGRNHK